MLDLIIKNGKCYIDGELKDADVAVKNGKIKKNDLILTEAIGGGLAWGAVVFRW